MCSFTLQSIRCYWEMIQLYNEGNRMSKGMIKLSVVTVALLMVITKPIEAKNVVTEFVVPAKESITGRESKHVFFGFSQIGVASGDSQNGDYTFQVDRLRLGWKYFSGSLSGKVFLDFAKDASDNGGIGVPDLVKDAFIAYKFNDAVVIKIGVIKTPVGMSFTIPGWNLDVIKRGFDKKLAFERAFGVMISGRDMGFGNHGKVDGLEMGHERPWKGFGYDIMIAGQTGRSGAVTNAKPGDANAYIGRIMFDWTELIHTEASYGISQSAGGIDDSKYNPNTGPEDYRVFNIGIDSHFDRSNIKAEYYDSENIRGVDGWNVKTLALTGTYYLTDTLEVAIKYIGGEGEKVGFDETEVSNTYLGLNYYINPENNKMDRRSKRNRNRHRIQLNYVLAGGDAGDVNSDVAAEFEKYASGAFFNEDTFLLQYQFKF